MAGRALASLKEEFPDLQITKVDVTLHPGKALQAEVRMIPCLIIDDKKLTGIMLSKEKIRSFLNQF